MKRPYIVIVGLTLLLLSAGGCNRAALRIPGASAPFPETATLYHATTKLPYRLVIELPSDDRAQYYGQPVAGTKWKGCSTDGLLGKNASLLIQKRLVEEFASSGLFEEVATNQAEPGDFVLKTDIHAFCSQVTGFLIDRVAGISSLQISMQCNSNVLMNQKFERVVTDADPEYTGSQVTMIEQAMHVTLADSLRELMKDLLKQSNADAKSWMQNKPPAGTAPKAARVQIVKDAKRNQ
jgi:hypothetical protein